jgi:L-ribulose-5-phosphate 3-epimerase
MMKSKSTRRQFLESALAASSVAAVAGRAGQSRAAAGVPPVCIFSKHLQFLDYKELATTCREIGLDAVDMPVRSGGHVLPENVAKDLPAAVEALRAEDLKIGMITTKLWNGDDPDAEPILKTASKLGIKYFRVGGSKYDLSKPPLPQLDKFTEGLRSLAKVAEKYGMVAGYHNHSGAGNVGGPMWDLHRMIEAVGSPNLGSNFDVGHVTAEGMYGAWRVSTRLMAPYVKMMSIKDFVAGGDGKRPLWTPIGEGIVQNTEILQIMREHGFQGPISIHVEYKVDSDDAMIEEVRKAVVTVRKCLKDAGY